MRCVQTVPGNSVAIAAARMRGLRESRRTRPLSSPPLASVDLQREAEAMAPPRHTYRCRPRRKRKPSPPAPPPIPFDAHLARFADLRRYDHRIAR